MSNPPICHAEPNSSADLNGHPAWGYGGTIPEHISTRQCFTSSFRRKSNVCHNDQLIPKPTDINVSEKMLRTATLKEHPYSSHISRFAMFPSFLSPDDPERGVRAASQSFLNPLIPNKPPDVTVLSKTIGGRYRHEVLENPVKTRKMAVSWTGENGFLDHPKLIEGEKQIFYPAPPKTVLPNPKLRDWDLSLSERTSNILKNLERKLWITSYQVDFTGPANPLKTDNFKEKISTLTGINLHSVPLRERSYPVLFPSKPEGGHGRRQQNKLSESSYIANSSGLQLPAANQITASSYKNQQQPQELMTNCNEAADMPQMGHSQSESKTDFTDAQHTDMSLEILQKQQPQSKSTVGHAREGENRKVRFNERPKQKSESKSSQDVALHMSNMQQHFNPNSQLYSQRQAKVSSERNSIELQKDDPPSKKEQLNSLPNASILAWLPVLPGIPGTNSLETESRTGTAHSLLDLQNSFSKSEAHQRFSNSITHAAVNLRNNVDTGKRHIFYGINCNHIHG